jgi:hypothetical protein
MVIVLRVIIWILILVLGILLFIFQAEALNLISNRKL